MNHHLREHVDVDRLVSATCEKTNDARIVGSAGSRKLTVSALVLVGGNLGTASVKRRHAAGQPVGEAAALAWLCPGTRAVKSTRAAVVVPALLHVGALAGKKVIDGSNPLRSDFMPLSLSQTVSTADEIAKAGPQTLAAKAIKALCAQSLSDSADGTLAMKALAESMDSAGLKKARYLQTLAGLNINFCCGSGLGNGIAATWIHRA
jgi:8-hydroxy-5-deazaflavin:NADPH oxidoreductase